MQANIDTEFSIFLFTLELRMKLESNKDEISKWAVTRNLPNTGLQNFGIWHLQPPDSEIYSRNNSNKQESQAQEKKLYESPQPIKSIFTITI